MTFNDLDDDDYDAFEIDIQGFVYEPSNFHSHDKILCNCCLNNQQKRSQIMYDHGKGITYCPTTGQIFTVQRSIYS
jgi:hypothetical protein